MALLMVTAPALASADPAAADEYESGKGCYRELLRQGRNAAASKWDSCIAFFDAYYEDHSDSPKALSALFSKARLEQEGYETHGGEKRLEGAIKDYNELIKRYPQSSLADDALYRVGCLRQDALDQPDRARKAFSALLDRYPKGDMALQAKARLDRLGPGTEGALANAATKAEAPTAAVADGPVVETETTPPQKENAAAIVTPAAEEKNAELARKAKEVVAGDGIVESDVPPVESTKDSFATMGEVADAFNRATLLDIGIKRAAGSTTVDLILDRSVAHSIEFTDMGLRTGSPPELEVVMLHTKPARDLAKERLLESAQVDSYEIKRLILSSGIKVAFKLKPGSGYKLSRTEQGLRVTFGSNDVAAMAPPPCRRRSRRKRQARRAAWRVSRSL